jgi:HEAT repeat protein
MADLDEPGLLTAVDALGRLGTKDGLEAVLEYTDDDSPQVRKFAIRALGRYDEPEAQIKLQEIQKLDKEVHLRNLALKYLNKASLN